VKSAHGTRATAPNDNHISVSHADASYCRWRWWRRCCISVYRWIWNIYIT